MKKMRSRGRLLCQFITAASILLYLFTSEAIAGFNDTNVCNAGGCCTYSGCGSDATDVNFRQGGCAYRTSKAMCNKSILKVTDAGTCTATGGTKYLALKCDWKQGSCQKSSRNGSTCVPD